MNIKGIFKGVKSVTGISIKFENENGKLIGKETKIKGKKFKTSVSKDKLFGASNKATLQVVIQDVNGSSSNLISKSKSKDLNPNSQTFTFVLKKKNKKTSLKISPATSTANESNEQENLWNLSAIKPLNATGVSPHIEESSNGYRLSYADNGPLRVSDLSKTFTLSNVGKINNIADLTVVTTANGARRGYYVKSEPNFGEKEIFAADISDDGLILSNSTATGFSSQGSKAWGVPDAVRIPDGRIRIYWVEDPQAGVRADEVIVSATSSDSSGTSFVRDAGQRTTGGYVDFEVLRAKKGDWVAVMSTTPATIPDSPQGIHVATSTDGLSWDVLPDNLAPTTKSYLDPTGIAIGPNQWQLVMSESESVLGDREYSLVHTTLSLA
jgi:hypothetical protein